MKRGIVALNIWPKVINALIFLPNNVHSISNIVRCHFLKSPLINGYKLHNDDIETSNGPFKIFLAVLLTSGIYLTKQFMYFK